MNISSSAQSKKLLYNSELFNLKIRQTRRVTVIDMQLFTGIVNTCEIPQTLEFLKQNHPSVLNTQCFNEKNLPFASEVVATEIGHLFEHILIDQLCRLKIKNGHKSAVYSGTTSWNWKENPYGLFQIWVDIGKKDLELLIEGLKIAIKLIKKLFEPILDTLLIQNSSHTNNLRATV